MQQFSNFFGLNLNLELFATFRSETSDEDIGFKGIVLQTGNSIDQFRLWAQLKTCEEFGNGN